MGSAAVILQKLPHEQPDIFKTAFGITPSAVSSKSLPTSLTVLPPPPAPKGGTGYAIGSQNSVAGVTGVATSRLEAEDVRACDAVKGLITRAALECGGNAYFYSCPNGAGRIGVHQADVPRSARARFMLVYSSSIDMIVGDAAPREHSEVMRYAMEMDGAHERAAMHWSEDLAAACVCTHNACEGILVVEHAPVIESSSDAEVLRCVKLWALVLGERLERLHFRQRATEVRAALVAAEAALRSFVKRDLDETYKKASDIIPHKCLEERVCSDRAALWFLDPLTQELVLNNSGHLDGIRIPTAGALSMALTRKQVIHIHDVDENPGKRYNKTLDERTGFHSKSVLCVPLNCGRINPKQDDEALAVLQFKTTRLKSLSNRSFEHFDLAGAEALMDSKLGKVVWLRHCFFKLLAAEKQIAHVEAVGAKLRNADGLSAIVRLVQGELTHAMHCEACTLWLIDDERDEVWAPPSEKIPNGVRLKIGDGIVGQAVESAKLTGESQIQVVNDPSKCPFWKGDADRRFTTRNIMTATVWGGTSSRRRPVAVVQALNKCRLSEGTAFGGPSFGESEIIFTESDAMLLELFLPSVGEHLQRLLLDISWTKTFMDKVTKQAEDDVEGDINMVHEYYNSDLAAMRSSQLSLVSAGLHRAMSRPAQDQAQSCGNTATRWMQKRAMTMVDLEGAKRAELDIDNWHIDCSMIMATHEFRILYEALHRFDVFSEIFIPKAKLQHYFDAVKQNYRSVPFHNFRHALATVHYAYKIAVGMNAQEHLSRLEVFILMISALCHDLDHRGHNSIFEICTRSDLALRYNDLSPLENHHCAQTFALALLSDGGDANIFDCLTIEQYSVARKSVIASILSTDMQNHGHLVEAVQRFEAEPVNGQFLVKLILHAADISQPLMPQDIAVPWARCLAEEFIAQAEDERQLGLPATAFMQGLAAPGAVARSQLAFIDFVVVPLMQPFFRMHTGLSEAKQFLEQNRAGYEREANLAVQLHGRVDQSEPH
mmetsp:Transcript_968/g.2696  ORF Transcript_968/g.2696 Transcript_968/m.2696 type:complete len:1000 (-) Transcript_968:43-3042(-)